MPTEPDLETSANEASVMLVREIAGYVRAGSLDRAEALVRTRLDDQPRFAFGHLLLGMIFMRGKRYEEAVEACERALDINPRLAPASLQIGRIHFEQDNHDLARDHIDTALDMDPNLASGHAMLATLAIEASDVPAAEVALREVLDIQPRHLAARLTLAELYVDDGRIRKAIRLLKAVVKDRPESLIAKLRLGRILAADGRYKAAVRMFESAANQAHRPARFHVLAGDAYRCYGRHADARDAYQKALSVQPGLERGIYGLADTLIDLGEFREAVETLQVVLERHARAHAVFQRQGLILTRTARFDQALNAFRAALRDDDSLIRRDPELASLLARPENPQVTATQVAERIRSMLLPKFTVADRETRQRQRDFAMHFRQMMPRANPLIADDSTTQDAA